MWPALKPPPARSKLKALRLWSRPDPFWETGDVERHDNHYPRLIETSTLELKLPEERPNLMEDIKVELKDPDADESDSEESESE